MKIGQYCQRQRCRHVGLEQFWQAFASRGFVSDSWAFLLAPWLAVLNSIAQWRQDYNHLPCAAYVDLCAAFDSLSQSSLGLLLGKARDSRQDSQINQGPCTATLSAVFMHPNLRVLGSELKLEFTKGVCWHRTFCYGCGLLKRTVGTGMNGMTSTNTVLGQEFAVVEEFVYLGFLVHSTTQSCLDISHHNAMTCAMQNVDSQMWKLRIFTMLKLFLILAFYPSSCIVLSAGQLPTEMHTRLMLSSNGDYEFLQKQLAIHFRSSTQWNCEDRKLHGCVDSV